MFPPFRCPRGMGAKLSQSRRVAHGYSQQPKGRFSFLPLEFFMSNTLSLRPGTRLRTGGTTYEVTEDASVPAGAVEVIPQKTRLLKVSCKTCGYTARITQRWITKAGTPQCPTCHVYMVVAEPKIDSPKVAASVASVASVATIPEPEPEPFYDDSADVFVPFEASDTSEPSEPATESHLAQLLGDI